MKKITLPFVVFVLFVFGYILTFASAFVDMAFFATGLIGIGLYFGPVALVSLILDRILNKNYDRNYLKKSIIFSVISIVITGLMILWLNNSMNIMSLG
jgi:hypothetical protein